MNANLEYYRIFRSVAQTGSFSAAAKELFITQPAVSQAMNHLERQLGTKLFRRTRKGSELTQEGNILYEHIASALQLIAVGEEKLERRNQLELGELKISAGDTISRHYLLPYLEQFHALYPHIRIQVINRTSRQAVELLKSGMAELALVNLPLSEKGVEVIELMEVEDIFVANQSLLPKKPLTPAALAQLPLIMLEDISSSRQYVENWFREQSVSLSPEIELGSHDLLIEFAKIGLGIACVIREFVPELSDSTALSQVPVTKSIPKRKIGLCFLKNVTLSACARQLIEMLNLSFSPCQIPEKKIQ